VNLFGPALKKAGMPSQAIVDTGRNAVQGLRKEWGDWCNVNGAGFGARPTGSTGDSMTDAFVWVKPGGESDGTSDSSATRYDSFCGKDDGKLSVRPSSSNTLTPFISLQAGPRSWYLESGLLRDAAQERQPGILKYLEHRCTVYK
jgi:hypothetical protein